MVVVGHFGRLKRWRRACWHEPRGVGAGALAVLSSDRRQPFFPPPRCARGSNGDGAWIGALHSVIAAVSPLFSASCSSASSPHFCSAKATSSSLPHQGESPRSDRSGYAAESRRRAADHGRATDEASLIAKHTFGEIEGAP